MNPRPVSELLILSRTREGLGIKQSLMASGLGISREMLSKIETGQRHLTLNAKMILMNMDVYLEHDGPVDPAGAATLDNQFNTQAAHWLNNMKAQAQVKLAHYTHVLRNMESAYAHSQELINRLKGAPPAGVTRPLPVRWVQRVVREHELLMEKNSPLAQVKLRAEMAKLQTILDLE
ncbi:MAG: helix-turn-helix domain-containing protein [Flavobacteriales bacterium]